MFIFTFDSRQKLRKRKYHFFSTVQIYIVSLIYIAAKPNIASVSELKFAEKLSEEQSN